MDKNGAGQFMEESMSGQLVRLSEAARALSVSTATLRMKVKAGEVPGRRLGKGHFRVNGSWLERMLHEDASQFEKDAPQAAA